MRKDEFEVQSRKVGEGLVFVHANTPRCNRKLMMNKRMHVRTCCLEDPVTLERILQRPESFPCRNSANVLDN